MQRRHILANNIILNKPEVWILQSQYCCLLKVAVVDNLTVVNLVAKL